MERVTNDAIPVRPDQRVVRARSNVAGALVVAESGRPAEAERRLRDALGVFERRHRYAAAARAAATLGYLLRERGDVSRAAQTYERARVLFNVAKQPAGPAADVPGGIVEDETEDYVHAKTLLSTIVKSSDDGTRVWVPDAALGAIVSAADQLCRACTGGPGAPTRLCACVQQLVGAKAVIVYATRQNRRLAEIGTIPPVLMKDALRDRPRRDGVTIVEARSAALGFTSIISGGKEVAVLIVLWSRLPDAVEASSLRAVVRLASRVGRADVVEALERTTQDLQDPSGIVGRSRAVVGLRQAIARAAPSPYPVVIGGETGSGKELVARALHRASARRSRPFCAVNCAALSDELFEAELFGYARGAFTRAVTQRAGLFEEANRARSSSMRSPSCHRGRKRNYCARSKKGRCGASERTLRVGSTSGWWPRRIAGYGRKWLRGGFGRTCSSGSPSSIWTCLRSGSAAPTWCCSPSISGDVQPAKPGAGRRWALRYWRR